MYRRAPPHMSPNDQHPHSAQASVLRTLTIEANAIRALESHLDAGKLEALVAQIVSMPGRLVVMGIGKSGHIGRKLAATFASTGTPSFFVHPAEAQHGDLGMIRPGDMVLALSYSGQTDELRAVLPHVRRLGVPVVGLTGKADSSLAAMSDHLLLAPVSEEACPHNLAPTASTTAALALGDALAVAVLERRGFTADDFARSHPGGALGRRLLVRVGDLMHKGAGLPVVEPGAPLIRALEVMSQGRLGMTCVASAEGQLEGIFTDGDLRRLIAKSGAGLNPQLPIGDVASRNPHSIHASALGTEAALQMEQRRLNHLVVLDDAGRLEGVIGLRDLLDAKVI